MKRYENAHLNSDFNSRLFVGIKTFLRKYEIQLESLFETFKK